MLINSAACEPHLSRRPRQLGKDVLHPYRPEILVRDGRDRFARNKLRIGVDLLDVVDRGDRRLHAFKGFDDFRKIVLSDPAADNFIDRIHMLDTIDIGLKA